ncbi:MAG: HlyD family efflux transporter periplasmic adaptor subunit [Desulfobacterales bacterium]|nr:HlyD family efflux transporter periplasmic adaptor subunit [Desulfobacterales bacterium]
MVAFMKPHAAQERLPPLRQDLSISTAAPGEDGSPGWLLHDPVANAYYRLGQDAFTMLSRWQPGLPLKQWLSSLPKIHRGLDMEVLDQFIDFLRTKGLTTTEDAPTRSALRKAHEQNQAPQNPLQFLLTHFLYFRIPLVNPDRFLTRILPLAAFFFHPWPRWGIRLLGLIGLFMIIRQWEGFLGGIPHFFTPGGALAFGACLFGVKALHELGHAYTAKRLGCRVPIMGMAFFLLYPLFYTDTTDAWRLPSPRQRLAIALAGIKVELALACLAGFLWNFMDVGILKSLMLLIATTSLISSLAINLLPFMRFDGYYALADALGAENLQPRAFSLARHHLRQLIFGTVHPPPESLPRGRRALFISYAYATWVYRFFLFTGIALMLYYFTFKGLGIALFLFEIHTLILNPILKEIKAWREIPGLIRINGRLILSLGIVTVILLTAFVPWQSRLTLPAVLEARETTTVYSQASGLLKQIHVQPGQQVNTGELLFELVMPELEKKKTMLLRRADYIQIRLDRHIASPKDLNELDILTQQWIQVQTDLKGIEKQIRQGRITAPGNGRVSQLIQQTPGQWVRENQPMAMIVSPEFNRITAYLKENQLHRIPENASALFYGPQPTPHTAVVTEIATTAMALLPHGELASVHGGPIPVRQTPARELKPEKSVYQVTLEIPIPVTGFFHRLPGQVRIHARPESPAIRAWHYALSVFIRESEF